MEIRFPRIPGIFYQPQNAQIPPQVISATPMVNPYLNPKAIPLFLNPGKPTHENFENADLFGDSQNHDRHPDAVQ